MGFAVSSKPMADFPLPHEARRCAVCGSTAYRVLYEIRDPARLKGVLRGETCSVSAGENIVRCQRCGLVYVTPSIVWPPEARAYPLEHDLQYFAHTRNERSIGNAFLLQLAQRLAGHRGKWLDVGCGDGLLVRQALAAGWDALGLEIDRALVEALGLREELPVMLTPIEQLDASMGPFDVISLINVLEHTLHPRQLLAACKERLHSEGILFIHVPNVKSLPARLRRAAWHHFQPLSHVTFFDRHTLTLLLEQAGLTVVRFFSLPSGSLAKRALLHLHDALGLSWHDGLGCIACFKERSYK